MQTKIQLEKIIVEQQAVIDTQKNRIQSFLKSTDASENKIYNLNVEIREKESAISLLKLKQISQMEAVKILFSIMSSAFTHRQKQLFAEQANAILTSQINELSSTMNFTEVDLPF